MADDIFVGSVSVGVVPDLRGFNDRLRAELIPSANRIGSDIGKAISKGISDNLGVTKVALEKMRKSITVGLSGIKVNVEVDVTKVMLDALKKKISSSLDKIHVDVEVGVTKANLARVRAEIIDGLSGIDIKVGVGVTKGSIAKTRTEIREGLKGIDIKIGASLTGVAARAVTGGGGAARGAAGGAAGGGIFGGIGALIRALPGGASGNIGAVPPQVLIPALAAGAGALPFIAQVLSGGIVSLLGGGLAGLGIAGAVGAGGASTADTASAQARLTAAKEREAAAQARLNQLQGGTAASPAAQQAAQLRVIAAQDRLNQLRASGRATTAQLASAEATLISAQGRLNALRTTGKASTAQLASAEAALASAHASVITAQDKLGQTKGITDSQQKLRNSFQTLTQNAISSLGKIGVSFIPVMQSIVNTAQTTLGKMTPVFANAVKTISGPFKIFVDTIITSFGSPQVQSSIQAVATAFGKVLTAFAPDIPGIINSFADAIERIANAVAKNPKAFADFLNFLFQIGIAVLDGIAFLTDFINYIEQHFIPAFEDVGKFAVKAWDLFWTNVVVRTEHGLHDIANIFDTVRHAIASTWNTIYADTFGKVVAAFNAVKTWVAENFDKWWASNGDAIKEIWNTLWNNLKLAFKIIFEPIKEIAIAVWDTLKFIFKLGAIILGAVWRGLWLSLKLTYETFFGPIVTAIRIAWDFISRLFQGSGARVSGWWSRMWRVIKGVFDVIWSAIKNLIKIGWDIIVGIFTIAINILTGHWRAAWNALKNMAIQVWNALVSFWQSIWNQIGGIATSSWNWIWSHVWVPVRDFFTKTLPGWFDSAITYVNNNWVKPFQNAIWGSWNWVVQHVWNPVSTFFTKTLPSWFDTAVNAVGKAWNKIKDTLKTPIVWVGQHVLVPLFSAIDAVTNFVGLHTPLQSTINSINSIGKARGGLITGGRGPTTDDNLALLARGELVVPAHMVDAGYVDHLRGRLPGFQGGGGLGLKSPTSQQMPYLGTTLAPLSTMVQWFGPINDPSFETWINFAGHGVQVNKAIAGNLAAAGQEAGSAGFGSYIRSIGGFRNTKGASGGFIPYSMHQFGAAVDINEDGGPNGNWNTMTLPQQLISIMANHGWFWGGNWGGASRDGGHFQFTGGKASGGLGSAIASGFHAIVRTVKDIMSGLGKFAAIGIDLAKGDVAGALSSVFGSIGHGVGGATGMLSSVLYKLPIQMAKSVLGHIVSGVKSFVTGQQSSGGTGGGLILPVSGPADAGPGQAANYAKGRMSSFGWSINDFYALQSLWTGESGWSRTARNPSSGAYGIPQALPASKLPAAGQASGGSHASPQIDWGMAYIKAVYGSPSKAYAMWQSRSPHWYAKGTDGAMAGWAWVGENGPELVHFLGGESVIPHEVSTGYQSGARTSAQIAAQSAANARARALTALFNKMVTAGTSIAASLAKITTATTPATFSADQTKFLADLKLYFDPKTAASRSKLVISQIAHMQTLQQEIKTLSGHIANANQVQQQVQQHLQTVGGITTVGIQGTGAAAGRSILSGLRTQTSQVTGFGNAIRDLARAGASSAVLQSVAMMDPTSGTAYARKMISALNKLHRIKAPQSIINQLVAAGPDAANAYVDAMIAAGPAVEKQIFAQANALAAAQLGVSRGAASVISGGAYNTGANFIKGLQSQEKQLNDMFKKLGRTLGEEAIKWFRVPANKRPYGFQHGGWIEEPVSGMGLYTGNPYTFAEHGRELVVPEGAAQRGSDGDSHYHAHFDGLTGAAIESHVQSAFNAISLTQGHLNRQGRRS